MGSSQGARFMTRRAIAAVFSFVGLMALSCCCEHAARAEDRLFRRQYHLADSSFCITGACTNVGPQSRRTLLFASRKTKQLQLLNADDGTVAWNKKLQGDQQSVSAFDLDNDGVIEFLYTVSSPGRLYVIDPSGNVKKQWDSGDYKLGNSPVVIDSDRDGVLDGYFGTRQKFLYRLNMQNLVPLKQRTGWVQCGCHTSALDVDGDGKWDLFAGSGDDSTAKGVLHRYDPISLKTVWSFSTDDNASSADPVLVDIDGDGAVEIIKSVDNYASDDAHDAVYAFRTDGSVIWKVEGLSSEDSPNVADLDNDGEVEIVGMTFGCEVFCLDNKGNFKWRKDLRPELGERTHAYLTPILCDLNGDRQLEILAMTSDRYFGNKEGSVGKKNAVLFALSADGEILDRFDMGGPRYWGEAFVTNVDADPFLELVIAGSGGLDVIETQGYGADVEYFQRRRTFQRLNVYPWAYEDNYFIDRGTRIQVTNETDNLVLKRTNGKYSHSGRFTTQLLKLPPGCRFTTLEFQRKQPAGTTLVANVLNSKGEPIRTNVKSGMPLDIAEAVKLEFFFTSNNGTKTPKLDNYSLKFNRVP